MKIQSLSIVVPTKGCINRCSFCVSRMHKEIYENRISILGDAQSREEYKRRLEYVRDNNCHTVILTGQGEPQQNKIFLKYFSNINFDLPSPFKNIEIQTTGAGLKKSDINRKSVV